VRASTQNGRVKVSEALQSRYSVRGYRPDPVPEELIREVFDIARLSASGTNTQPWHVAVVSGDACDRLRDELCALFDAGEPQHRAFPGGAAEDGVYLDRRRACGFGYYETMGVGRKDKEGRIRIARKNFELFGAPHAAFFSMPRNFGYPRAVDMGIFLQAVMLVMVEKGLGCIAQGSLAGYPDPVRAIADVPDDNDLVFGLSFGYEDPDAHINTVRMTRASLDEVVSFTS
jgi:nitroreductase